MTSFALTHAALASQYLEASFLSTLGKAAAVVVIIFIAIGLVVGLVIGFFIGRAVGRSASHKVTDLSG